MLRDNHPVVASPGSGRRYRLEGETMDGNRFDAWVRALQSRRTAVRTLAGAAALVLPARALAGPAACAGNGSKCDPTTPEQCCTGNCAKRKGKFKCAPAGSAQGCTKQQDACHGVETQGCPDNPGSVGCVVGKGKPLCASDASCRKCKSDADCTTEFGPTARCVKGCNACKGLPGGFTSACVVPAPPPV
jgi:hypothetical protein